MPDLLTTLLLNRPKDAPTPEKFPGDVPFNIQTSYPGKGTFEDEAAKRRNAELAQKAITGKDPYLADRAFDLIGGVTGLPIGEDSSAKRAGDVLQAVTMFGTPEARKLATQKFFEMASKLAYPFDEALTEFGHQFPRIAAHMEPNILSEMPEHGGSAHLTSEYGQVRNPMKLELTPKGSEELIQGGPTQNLNRAREIVWHEGTHGAQALGNKHFTPLYRRALDMVGYRPNPFEVKARIGGTRGIFGPAGPEPNAIDMLRKMAEDKLNEPEHYVSFPEPLSWLIAPTDAIEPEHSRQAAKDILELLNYRENNISSPNLQEWVKFRKLTPYPVMENVGQEQLPKNVQTVIDMLNGPVEGKNPLSLLANDKVTGWVPHRAQIQVPPGFELPEGTSRFMARDPKLVDRYVQEQSRTVPRQPTQQSGTFLKGDSGRRSSGNRSTNVLNQDMVRQMRQDLANGLSAQDILKKYPNFSSNTVRSVLKGDSWGWVK